jgi:hypothetical protein
MVRLIELGYLGLVNQGKSNVTEKGLFRICSLLDSRTREANIFFILIQTYWVDERFRGKSFESSDENKNVLLLRALRCVQGCQMVYFPTKNPNLSKSLRALQWKIFVHFVIIWSILRPYGIFCGH